VGFYIFLYQPCSFWLVPPCLFFICKYLIPGYHPNRIRFPPFFIVNKLPVGMLGLVIAAVMAAGMSTLDSSLNSSSTAWTIDF
jgi:SSS family solute:Na+ symporter